MADPISNTGPLRIPLPILGQPVPAAPDVSVPLRVGGPDLINYAPPGAPTGQTPAAPGVPSLSGVDARFAAVPERPARPDGGFLDQGSALEYHNALHAHNVALKDARQYAQTAKYLNDLHHEASQQVEAGDFLSEFAGLKHDSPDYETATAKLLAKYPNAGGNQAVAEALSVKHAARQNNFAIQNQKRVEDEKTWQALQSGAAGGFLQNNDFTTPGAPHPELGLPTVNTDGTVNTHNAMLLLALRQSTQKNERGETAAQAADRADYALHSKEAKALEDAGDTTSPAYQAAKGTADALYQRIAQRDYTRVVRPNPGTAAGTTGPSGPPAPVASSSASQFIIKKKTP